MARYTVYMPKTIFKSEFHQIKVFVTLDLTILNPDTLGPGRVYPMPDLQGLPDSYALGACGMPG